MFGRSKSLVGLDIGSSAVKAIELKPAGKAYKVTAFGSEAVPPDSIVDGAIIDATAVVDAIRRLFSGLKVTTKEVAASLSGNAVIVKKISLPSMTEAELAESIYWEAEQYIPFDIQDVNLDYQILDRGDVGGKSTMEVLLVAAKKEKIADYTGVIGQAGRVAVVIDVDAFALQNAYEVNYGTEPDAVVVLLNVGASATNINILHGDQSVFTRDISTGGQRLHRSAAEGAEPAVRAGRRAQARCGRRRRDLRRRAAGAAGGHRERDARGAEDVRLLQDVGRLRSDHADRGQRRRVARRKALPRCWPSASRRRSSCSTRSSA